MVTLVFGVLLSCRGEEAAPEEAAEREAAVAEAAIDDWPCEEQGYPCTWEEVSAETTERTFALADQALDRFEPGKETELVAWLEAQPGVAEAEAEAPTVVWFRHEGGGPIYVHVHSDETSVLSGSPFRDTSQLPGPRLMVASASHLLALPLEAIRSLRERTSPRSAMPGVTGKDRNRDRRVNQRDERRALVLEPVDWEFCYSLMADRDIGWVDKVDQTGVTGSRRERLLRQRKQMAADVCTGKRQVEGLVGLDIDQGVDTDPNESLVRSEGELVEAILNEMPAYGGNVTRLINEQVDLSSFENWTDFDVIYLNSHGTFRSATIGDNLSWSGRGRLSGAAARRRGLSPWVARIKGFPGAPKQRVWNANARFFKSLYPRGLDRTLIYFSTCSGAGDPSGPSTPLAASLLGDQSMFIGWGATVGVKRTWEVTPLVFKSLARGWAGEEAIRRVPMFQGGEYGDPVITKEIERSPGLSDEDVALGLGVPVEVIREKGPEAAMGMVLGWRGSDMRIREVVRLLHPRPRVPMGDRSSSGQGPVRDGDDLSSLIEGELGDGEPDRLRVTVEVEAIRPDQAGQTSVHLELDGKRIGSSKSLAEGGLVSPSVSPETVPVHRVDFENVPAGEDLEPEQEYELEAVVQLPEKGESRYAAILSSRACYWELELDSSPRAGRYSGNVANVMAPPGGEILIQLSGTDPYMMINVSVRGEISSTGERRFSMGGISSTRARARGWEDPPDDGAATIVFQAEPLMSHLVYTTGDGTPIYDTVNGTSRQVGNYPPFSDLYLRGDPASSVRGRMTGLLAVSPDFTSPPTEQVRAELRFRAKNPFGTGGMPRFDHCGRGS